MLITKKKKIFYWSPCLNPVGTVISTLNSAISLNKYGKKDYEIYLINSCGEWNEHKEKLKKNNIKIISFDNNIFKYLPKRGYIQSRFSYLIIFILSFFPLKKLLHKQEPSFLVIHLISSLPLILLTLFKFKTSFILRISGMPKLNFFRRSLWRLVSTKLYCITSPSEDLRKKLIEKKLFNKDKLFFLPDAILNLKDFVLKKNEKNLIKNQFENKKIIFAAGRLTKQKNFSYLIDEFESFSKTNRNFVLIILGDGEDKIFLKNKIYNKGLTEKVILKGQVSNVFKYFKNGELFILSSLWEEVGFVIVEAAMSNLFVISSDCPNGPSEFLDKGNNGILFKSNVPGALCNGLIKYSKLTLKEEMKKKLKKNAKKYTLFYHYLKLINIIRN